MDDAAKPADTPAEKQWSEEDVQWLTTIPEAMKATAKRHGRVLFQLTMGAGSMTHGLGVIASQGRGNRAIGQALGIIQQITNGMAMQILKMEGKTLPDFMECKGDVERVMALLDAGQRQTGDRVSPGGIILDS